MKKLSYALPFITLLILTACDSSKNAAISKNAQQQLDAAARDMQVSLTLVSNIAVEDCPVNAQPCYLAEMRLGLPDNMPANWRIYFSSLTPIAWDGSDDFDIRHINGDLHEIIPLKSLKSATGNYLIPFKGAAGLVSQSVLFPNYILAAEGLRERVIHATQEVLHAGEQVPRSLHVQDFLKPEQRLRSVDDQVPFADAAWRYARNETLQLEQVETDENRIVPRLKESVFKSEHLDLRQGLDLSQIASLYPVASQRLIQLGIINNHAGVPLSVVLNSKLSLESNDESYQIHITEQSIQIQAASSAGVFYALMSLGQLYDPLQQHLPLGSVSDAPRYHFRGLHVDLARNFHSKDFLLRLVDQMAYYKLNKLHLHLADDEGWRLAIPGLPELTDVASKRCLDWQENLCLQPQLAAGVDSEGSNNGYLSDTDYIALLKYADERHVEIIPALDMPGHSRAAVIAMQARYRNLMKQEQTADAEQYWLSEPADTSVYSSIQHYRDNTLNPCLDSTYRFVSKVLQEVQTMHRTAGVPLRRYHIGADETAGAWRDSPACQTLLSQHPEIGGTDKLSAYFVERVANMVAEMGVIPAAWSDGLAHAKIENLPAKVQSNIWDTLYSNGFDRSNNMVNAGWDVVLSLPDVLYFDFPYEADPIEPGYYWGSRATDSYQVFQFMPDNLPAHAELWPDKMGKPYRSVEQISLNPDRRVLGIQAQLWSETVRSDQQATYMLFPRLLAFAERAWHRPAWAEPYTAGQSYDASSGHIDSMQLQQMRADWQGFAHVMSSKIFKQLVLDGMVPRVPLPGANIVAGQLSINTHFPGLVLEYQQQGGEWQTYQQPVSIDSASLVRARIDGTQITSRVQLISPQ
jgi:hexosaminidase